MPLLTAQSSHVLTSGYTGGPRTRISALARRLRDLTRPRLDGTIQQLNHYLADKYYGNHLRAIHWIEIYPVDSVIHLSEKLGPED